MKNYLLEIGIEELPATNVVPAITQLKEKFTSLLKEYELNHAGIRTLATPRRLSLIVENLDENQKASTISVKGPSAKISFDENNQPTKALQGFMKSQGVMLEDLETIDNYVYAKVNKAEVPTAEILLEELPKLIKSINFPKNMKWGGKSIKFARPIRWIVSIFGEEIVPVDLEGIVAGNKTRGHRFLGSSDIEIQNADSYEEALKENYVIADSKKRMERIEFLSEKLAREVGGELHDDEALLSELTYITEFPTPILGKIKSEYLNLPPIVITTPMKEHLRFVPIYKNENNLLPYFISVRNGTEDNKDIVIKGNEKVLGARLEDAKFFYEADLTQSLDDLTERLDGIMYHEKLGTVRKRVDRLAGLTEKIGESLEIAQESKNQLKRAAEISKADLLTKMVSEFTELQGIMGEIYATKSGENSLVAKAIREQYLPRYSGDKLPETTVGSILSIADKLDAISGLFAVDITPTGSQDPFALRRAALGIINIIRNNKWNISIKQMIKDSLYEYVDKNNLVFDYEEVSDNIYEFIISRIKVILLEEGIRYDLVDAILKSKSEDIHQIFRRSNDLDTWIHEDDKDSAVEAFNRLNNIAVKAEHNHLDENMFNEEENNLYRAYAKVKEEIESSYKDAGFKEYLSKLESLVSPINKYLDDVLVFVDDVVVRENRLALLKTINDFINGILDFSSIIE